MSKSTSKLITLVALAVFGMAGTAQAQPFVYALGKVRLQIPGGGPMPSSEHQLHVINAATNRLVAITTFGDSQYSAIAMSPDGARVYVGEYVGNGDGRGLSVVSTRTHKVEDTWPESVVGLEPSAMAVSPDSRRLYVASSERIDGRVVLAIDVATRTRLAKLSFGARVLVGVAVSPDGSRLYIATTDSSWFGPKTDNLTVLNTTTFGVIAEIPLSGNAQTSDVSLSPDGRFAYLSRRSVPLGGGRPAPPGLVEIVDTTTQTVVATIPFSGETPRAVGLSPDGAAVYVAVIGDTSVRQGDALHRLDPSTHTVAGKTSVPLPLAVAFLPDSSRAYVAADDKVVVLDTATHTVIATIGELDYVRAIVTTPTALDPEPTPGPPTLTVSVSGTTAHLSWTPAAGPSPLSYVLEAGTSPNLSNVFNSNVGATTTLTAASVPGGTYFVRVRAVNAAGVSAPSNEVTLVVGGTVAAPGPPTITSAVATGGILSVSWQRGAGPVPTSHRLDFYSGGSIVASVNAGAATSVALPIPPGTQGTFEVRATAANGAVSGLPSAPTTFTIAPGCSPPASPNLGGAVVNGTATVNWSAVPDATSYVLSAGTTPGGTQYMPPTNLGTNTGASASGLSAGFTAWVRVFAVNACGQQSAAVDFLVQ